MSEENVDYLKVSVFAVQELNELSRIINDWATKKGWNEGADSVQRKSSDIALMHSELSECLEFVRHDNYICDICGPVELDKFNKCPEHGNMIRIKQICDDHVPYLTGEAAELADVLIRIFHYCGRRGINLGEAVQLKHAYNIKRPYKHGKKL